MEFDVARDVVERFYVRYMLHPLSVLPLVVAGALLPILGGDACRSHCARVATRMRFEEATDVMLLFCLLALLALPFGVDLLWRLAKRHRLLHARRTTGRKLRDFPFSLAPWAGGIGLALFGFVIAAGTLVLTASAGPPEGPPVLAGLLRLLVASVSWHLALAWIFDGCVIVVADWYR